MEVGELRELLQIGQPQGLSSHVRDVVAEASSFHLNPALTVERPLSLILKLDRVSRECYGRGDLIQDLLKCSNRLGAECQAWFRYCRGYVDHRGSCPKCRHEGVWEVGGWERAERAEGCRDYCEGRSSQAKIFQCRG